MTERDRCINISLVPLARPRAGLTLRSKMIGIPTLRRRAEVVGGEAGRVDGVEVLGRKHVGLCLVSHPIGGGVDKLFSGKGLHRMRIEGTTSLFLGARMALDQVGVLSVGRVVERASSLLLARGTPLSSLIPVSTHVALCVHVDE